jgi:hypothetical protein
VHHRINAGTSRDHRRPAAEIGGNGKRPGSQEIGHRGKITAHQPYGMALPKQ